MVRPAERQRDAARFRRTAMAAVASAGVLLVVAAVSLVQARHGAFERARSDAQRDAALAARTLRATLTDPRLLAVARPEERFELVRDGEDGGLRLTVDEDLGGLVEEAPRIGVGDLPAAWRRTAGAVDSVATARGVLGEVDESEDAGRLEPGGAIASWARLRIGWWLQRRIEGAEGESDARESDSGFDVEGARALRDRLLDTIAAGPLPAPGRPSLGSGFLLLHAAAGRALPSWAEQVARRLRSTALDGLAVRLRDRGRVGEAERLLRAGAAAAERRARLRTVERWLAERGFRDRGAAAGGAPGGGVISGSGERTAGEAAVVGHDVLVAFPIVARADGQRPTDAAPDRADERPALRGAVVAPDELVRRLSAAASGEAGALAEEWGLAGLDMHCWCREGAVIPDGGVPVLPGGGLAILPAPPQTAGTWALLQIVVLAGAAIAAIAMFLSVHALRQHATATRTRADFVTSVTHELKTPLASIRLLSERLQAGSVRDPSRRAEYHALLAGEAARLSMLLENVLDLGRMERGERGYDRRPVDPAHVVGDALAVFEPVARAAGMRVDAAVEPSGDGPRAMVDAAAVQQVLLNLFDNARKYAGAGTLSVTGRIVDDAAVYAVTVADQGPGVPPEERERIFGQFVRGRAQADGHVPGVGLGLHLARRIARDHGGELACIDRSGPVAADRAGASFELRLPLESAARGGADLRRHA